MKIEEEVEENGLGDCKQVVIAKKYNSIEDLKRDNNDEDIII